MYIHTQSIGINELVRHKYRAVHVSHNTCCLMHMQMIHFYRYRYQSLDQTEDLNKTIHPAYVSSYSYYYYNNNFI